MDFMYFYDFHGFRVMDAEDGTRRTAAPIEPLLDSREFHGIHRFQRITWIHEFTWISMDFGSWMLRTVSGELLPL